MEYGSMVLGAIVPNRRDLLLFAMQHLEPEHFRGEVERNIFTLLTRYYDWAGDVLPVKLLLDMLHRQQVDETKQLLYEQTYTSLAQAEVPDHEFRYAVYALKDARAQVMTGEAIATTFEILERGADVDGERLEGHKDARSYFYSIGAEIDRLDHIEASPEGDMRKEAEDVLAEYAERKAGKSITGVLSGIPELDMVTGGFQNGELCLICAYTSEGKSQFCSQLAWNVAVEQGKNVFFGTSETVRRQVRRRIICRHSRLPQFGLPNGINVRDLRDGTLGDQGEEVLKAVMDDLDHNPSYGKIYIAQIPRGATLGFLEARMRRQADLWQMDMAVFDYLALLKVDKRRDGRREELNDILQDAKVMATSFYDGKGVPFISPWQMSQTSWRLAVQRGAYELANLADTSEAEKSSDQIVALLRDQNLMTSARMQLLKNRDGEALPPFPVAIDYRNAYFGHAEDDVAQPPHHDPQFLNVLGL